MEHYINTGANSLMLPDRLFPFVLGTPYPTQKEKGDLATQEGQRVKQLIKIHRNLLKVF